MFRQKKVRQKNSSKKISQKDPLKKFVQKGYQQSEIFKALKMGASYSF